MINFTDLIKEYLSFHSHKGRKQNASAQEEELYEYLLSDVEEAFSVGSITPNIFDFYDTDEGCGGFDEIERAVMEWMVENA